MHEILISVTATGDCGPQRPYVPPSPPHPPTKSHSFKQPCICMFHRLDVYTLQSSTAYQFLIRFSTIEYRVKFQFQIL